MLVETTARFLDTMYILFQPTFNLWSWWLLRFRASHA